MLKCCGTWIQKTRQRMCNPGLLLIKEGQKHQSLNVLMLLWLRKIFRKSSEMVNVNFCHREVSTGPPPITCCFTAVFLSHWLFLSLECRNAHSNSARQNNGFSKMSTSSESVNILAYLAKETLLV